MRLILGEDILVANWVAARIPHMARWGVGFAPGAPAIGVVGDRDVLIGGVVFTNWSPQARNIEVSFASETPRWLTRRLISGILAYPFDQLDCQRITAVTPKKAADARRFLDKFGFKREGVVRRGFGDDDAVISGLMRREWEQNRFNVRARSLALAA